MLSIKKQSIAMARLIAVIFVSLLLAFSVAQAGNDKGKKGKGKPDKEQVMNKDKHKDKREDKSMKRDDDHEEDHDDDRDHEKGKKDKKDKKHKDDDRDEHDDDDDDGSKGLEKQRDKKSEQESKELGKGSEQGQASREEHSRKWWKFWGDEE